MIEKLVEVGVLFDFYGKLLSSRQWSVIELFYIHDLSLTEIGEELDISKQSVYDTLKRSEKKLYEYEENLSLVDDFRKNTRAIKSIIETSGELLSSFKNNEDIDSNDILNKVKEIESTGKEILKNSREVGS